MFKTIKRAMPLLGLLLAWMPADTQAAGQNRAGTASGSELLIPVGARDMALGGASVATTSGLEALHWNPAGLARANTDANAMFSTMSYLADIRVNYLAASARFGGLGSLGLSIKALDFGNIPITTETAPDGTGGTYSPTFFNLGLHYARMLTDRINLGITTNYLVNRIQRVEGSSLSFSAGLQYADLGSIEGLDLGVAIKHIGQRMQYDGSALLRRGQLDNLERPASNYKVDAASADLPSTFEIGLGYRYIPAERSALNFSTVFRHNNFTYDQLKLGTEYVFDNRFALRGGFDYATDETDDTYIFGTSFGFGLMFNVGGLKDARLDYAYTTVDFFDPLNTFTFQVGF